MKFILPLLTLAILAAGCTETPITQDRGECQLDSQCDDTTTQLCIARQCVAFSTCDAPGDVCGVGYECKEKVGYLKGATPYRYVTRLCVPAGTTIMPPVDPGSGDMSSEILDMRSSGTPDLRAILPDCPAGSIDGTPLCGGVLTSTTCQPRTRCGDGRHVKSKDDCSADANNFAGAEGSDGFCTNATEAIMIQVNQAMGGTKLRINAANTSPDVPIDGTVQVIKGIGAYGGLVTVSIVDNGGNPILNSTGTCWSVSGGTPKKGPISDIGGVAGCRK